MKRRYTFTKTNDIYIYKLLCFLRCAFFVLLCTLTASSPLNVYATIHDDYTAARISHTHNDINGDLRCDVAVGCSNCRSAGKVLLHICKDCTLSSYKDSWAYQCGVCGSTEIKNIPELCGYCNPGSQKSFPAKAVRCNAYMSPPATLAPTRTPTLAPSPAPSKNPVPTVPSTPAPVATSTPTPVIYRDDRHKVYENSYSTNAGYSISTIIHSTSYQLASFSGVQSSNTSSLLGTNFTGSYLKGSDIQGNQWYFCISGNSAIMVHPYIYQGISSPEQLTEIIYPESVTYHGVSYTVTDIGGFGAYYGDKCTSTDSNTIAYSSSYDYRYGKTEGTYCYNYFHSNSSYDRYRNTKVSYYAGSFGNGMIKSEGSEEIISNLNGSSCLKYYANNHYVYNSALLYVYIPYTVKTVQPYTFMYCQQLSAVEGCEGLVSIGRSAFETASPSLCKSVVLKQNTYLTYYYYNKSFADTYGRVTNVMSQWQNDVNLSGTLSPVELPSVQTISSKAFYGHKNLSTVILNSDALKLIDFKAFADCNLEEILISSDYVSIYSHPATLGANISLIDSRKTYEDIEQYKTRIICSQSSAAYEYSRKYPDYYTAEYEPEEIVSDSDIFIYHSGYLKDFTESTRFISYSAQNVSDVKPLEYREYGESFIALSLNVSGYFDHILLSGYSFSTPETIPFDSGNSASQADDSWHYEYLIHDYGEESSILCDNKEHIIRIDFFSKENEILRTEYVKLLLIPYSVWRYEINHIWIIEDN